MDYIKLFKQFESIDRYPDKLKSYLKSRDKDLDDYLKDLNAKLKRSREESKKDYSEYFKLISHNEAADIIDKMVDFDEIEVKKITELFPERYNVSVSIWDTYNSGWENIKSNYFLIVRNETEIKIWKIEDEYYLLSVESRSTNLYYLCDQFDGLSALIRKMTTRIFESVKFDDSGFIRYISNNDNKFNPSNKDLFNNKEVNEIKDILVKYRVSEFNTSDPSKIKFYIPYRDKKLKKYIRIEKYKDEWFLLVDYLFCYECDQLDGLLNCLKSILPSKINESLSNSQHYFRVNQNEFDEILTNPDIHSLSASDISILEKFAKDSGNLIKLGKAEVYAGNQLNDPIWFMLDVWGLDKAIESEWIQVSGKRYNFFDSSDKKSIIIENFTARLIYTDTTYGIKYDIDIMKCQDEWFLVSWEDEDGYAVMYKCDQIDGVIKLLKDVYETH